jgi:hypothetical protein
LQLVDHRPAALYVNVNDPHPPPSPRSLFTSELRNSIRCFYTFMSPSLLHPVPCPCSECFPHSLTAFLYGVTSTQRVIPVPRRDPTLFFMHSSLGIRNPSSMPTLYTYFFLESVLLRLLVLAHSVPGLYMICTHTLPSPLCMLSSQLSNH